MRFLSRRERRRGGRSRDPRGLAAQASQARPTGSVPIVTPSRLMLFSGRANPALAAAIGRKLGIELGHVTLKTFSAGELYCRYEESVRGADVFIVQPTCANAAAGLSAAEAMMELLVMIDAAVGASANRVIAVMPSFGYARQDKKSALREPISARLVAHLLETAGVDRVFERLRARPLESVWQQRRQLSHGPRPGR